MNRQAPAVVSGVGLGAQRGKHSAADAVAALLDRFPPRSTPAVWSASLLTRGEVLDLMPDPGRGEPAHATWRSRRAGAEAVLQWLESFPGETWQQRWSASPAAVPDPACA